jgi:prepilin-type N-terminal cleavage/methylation domain-containing protein/prepilin-type processing-associated H-X9-DG protein
MGRASQELGRERGLSRIEGKRTGFTLVELLVVIGIIALLIGILLPALTRARKSALEAVCMSDLRQWGIGLQMYVDQNHGFLPVKGPDGTGTYGSANFFGPPVSVSTCYGVDDPSLWFNAIPPLVNGKSYYQLLLDDMNHINPAPIEGQHSIFICPAAAPAGTQNNNDTIVNSYFMLNGLDSTGTLKNSTGMFGSNSFKFNCSYVWNSQLATSTATGDEVTIKMTTLRPASEIVVMTEKIANSSEYKDPGVQHWCTANPSVYGSPSSSGSKINTNGRNQNIAQSKADWTRFAARHRGGGMLLFADGHVSWFAWPSVQYPQSQLPLTQSSDVNHYGSLRWSAIGPVNSGTN